MKLNEIKKELTLYPKAIAMKKYKRRASGTWFFLIQVSILVAFNAQKDKKINTI